MRRSAPFRFGSLEARPPHTEAGQRIGLLGGSFNPPHAAHLLITEIALRRLNLDRVWWLVTPGNPLKSRSELLPLSERVALARSLVKDPRVIVTDFEKRLGSSFTAATIGHLQLRQRDVHFVWLMGADCLAGFHRWQQWTDIFRTIPIAVIDRPGWRLRALSSKSGRAFSGRRWPEAMSAGLAVAETPCWTLLSGPLLPISSTEIRANARRLELRGAEPEINDRDFGQSCLNRSRG
jgi:nicotinate-nucleotide adenylyltransferase